MRYEFLDVACVNRSFLCTVTQFNKEYKPLYPEINYSIPKEVLENFGDPAKASDQCLLILLNPIMNLNEAAWLCHPDIKIILDYQVKISKIIYDFNMKSYDFVADYIQNKSVIIKGIMTLNNEKFIFNDHNKKMVLSAAWKDVEPYAYSLYLKEEIEWKGTGTRPESQRCLRFYRKSEIKNKNPDYFCAYFHRNDITRRVLMKSAQGRFAAEMYTNKINIRLHAVTVKANLLQLAKMNQKSLEVDAKILFALKMEVRRMYFVMRHGFINLVKAGLLKKIDLNLKLADAKAKSIEKVCAGNELCKKAMNFSIDKGYLPLKGKREKFAMDLQNPFNSRMPKLNIKIDLPKTGSMGKAIMSAVAKMKGTKNYFAEKIPESPAGQVPNMTAIRKAFNTVFALREKREYKSMSQVSSSCKAGERNASNNIRRKISLLWYAGDNDVFFEYLGFIRDFQLTKK